MYVEERQEAIAVLVRSRGRVGVTDVAARFGVTTETVRRDLAALERMGVVRRVHGGAVPTAALSVVEPGVAERDTTQAQQKERIARAALDLVPPAGGSVLLDGGTTTGRLARLLPVDRDLVVLTNSVPAAALLAGLAGVRLHLLGGRVRGVTQTAVGEETVRALRDVRVDVVFLGTNAVSGDHGLSTPDPDEAAVKRAMVAAGQRVVALADSSKVGREHLFRFAALDQVDVLVTDDDLDESVHQDLTARDLEVVLA